MGQAYSVLSSQFGGAVTYDATTQSCDPHAIGEWICAGKIVMVLANFYTNNSGSTGGHFVLAVAVQNGNILTADPYYPTKTPFDGKTEYGHIHDIVTCLTVDASAVH
jgi:hypothetical protein